MAYIGGNKQLLNLIYTGPNEKEVYDNGYNKGVAEGDAAGYNRGLAKGETIGYSRGYNEGDATGYDRGFSEGKTDGYNNGLEEGELIGYNKGEEAGYNNGYESGLKDGEATGYDKGYTDGNSKGYSRGYDKGMLDGETIGHNKGIEEGRQAERDDFWDVLQSQGKARSYYYAFAYDRFNDETFNPKHDIVANTSSSAFQNMFYNNYLITDTKVTIDARNTSNISGLFNNATSLKTVRKLIVSENVTRGGDTAFNGCESLEDIEMEGINAQSMSFASSPLTVDSMKSIISCLKDFSGTSTTYTLTFRADRESMLPDEEKTKATSRGWTLVWQ